MSKTTSSIFGRDSTPAAFLLAAFFSLSLTTARPVWADSSAANAFPNKQPTLDPRLPPVIPGEEVNRNNQKIKVWSTSGSPSVGTEVPTPREAPQNWTVGHNKNNDHDVSVIVDGSDLVRRPVNRPHDNR